MRVCVIGAGLMGQRHVTAAIELGLGVVGICDIRPEALDVVGRAARLRPSALFRDPEAMLDAAKPEVVIVATTADTHSEFTCLAAEHGARFILCEKPMAVSLEQCERMLAACERNGVRLGINHPRRFLPRFQAVAELMASEEFGPLRSLTVIGGNMGLAMNGSHFIEFFHFLTEDPAIKVNAWLLYDPSPNPRGARFSDPGGSLRAETSNGRRLYIDVGTRQGHGISVTYAGTRGLLVVDELAGTARLSVRDELHRDAPTNRYGLPSVIREYTLPRMDPIDFARESIRALIDPAGGVPDGHDGFRTIRILAAGYVSDERNHVAIDLLTEPLPRERVFSWA
jgi:predicted dehydrogenase